MKEIKFSFDEDNGGKNEGKEAEVIDLSEYRQYIKEFFNEDLDDNGEIQENNDDNDEYDDHYEYADEDEGLDEEETSDDENGLEYSDDSFSDEDDDGLYDEGMAKKGKKRKRPSNKQPLKKQAVRGRRKGRILVKAIGAAAVLAAVGTVILASPVFAVQNIEINELQYFTKEDICSRIGLETGDNGVFFNKGKAEKILESDKYISSVDISFRFPDTMVITVDENRICGYINYLGNYLYLDREGRVIDVKSETSENLPIIEGLKFSSFTVGEVMQVENQESFEAALVISKAMSKYDVLDKKVSINVADSENIYAYVDNIKVLLGDTSRMEEKIKTMSEAVAEIPEGDMGTLDLQDLSKPIIFKYST